jgi:hypothetical protein
VSGHRESSAGRSRYLTHMRKVDRAGFEEARTRAGTTRRKAEWVDEAPSLLATKRRDRTVYCTATNKERTERGGGVCEREV